jgi:hypothetical protein
MTLLKSCFLAFIFAALGMIPVVLVIFLLGFGGALGSVLWSVADRSDNRMLRRLALITTYLGQSYVALAFVVLVISALRVFLEQRPTFYAWPFWIAGFFLAAAPPTYAMKEEEQPATSQHIAMPLTTITAIVGFFVLAFFPVVASTAWPWVPFQKSVGRTACKVSIMSFIDAHRMMSDGKGNVVQLSNEQAEKLKALIRQGLRSSDRVPERFLDSVHPKLRSEFNDHLVAGWRLYLEGLEGDDPVRQVAGIQRLQLWEVFREANADLLYQRIIE